MAGAFDAWVDESIRRSGLREPVYLLGATITSPAGYETISHVLKTYAPKGNKLHWRDLGSRGKQNVAHGLSTLELEHIIIIRTLVAGMSEERARGLCIERLMWELDSREITNVTFESRSPHKTTQTCAESMGLDRKTLLAPPSEQAGPRATPSRFCGPRMRSLGSWGIQKWGEPTCLPECER